MTNELQYYLTLKRITRFMTPEALRKKAEKLYGVSGDEAIEMAYDNIIAEARIALRHKRRPKE